MAGAESGKRGKKPGGGSASAKAYAGPVQRKAVAPGKRTRTMSLPEPAPAVTQRRASGAPATANGSASGSTGSGKELPPATREKMEGSFGADFSAVRVHESPRAADMGAVAVTEGSDIHFAPGELRPDTTSGQELIGHELTHVVQQSRGQVSATTQAKGVEVNDDASLERQADEAGVKAARGQRVDVARGATPGSGARTRGVAQCKLKLIGDRSAINRALQVLNNSMHGYNASANRAGNVTLARSAARGRANDKQIAMYEHLKKIIGDAKETVVRVEGSNRQVIGGKFSSGVVDMKDIMLFGTEGGMTSQGALIHEIVEQYEKQTKGQQYGGMESGAHGEAVLAENEVGDSTRGKRQVVSRTDHTDGTYDAVVKVPYTFPDGREVTTTLTIRKSDLISATHRQTARPYADGGDGT